VFTAFYGFTSKLAVVVTPFFAETVTDTGAVTALVVTTNVAVVECAGTVMLVGTVAAAVLLLVSVTLVFTAGAASRVTVAVACVPPRTVEGLIANEATLGVRTLSVAVFVTPAYRAEIVVVMVAVTAEVLTAKVVVFCPASTTTVGGTAATGLFELDRVTVKLAAAAPDMVTVPVALNPPAMIVGLMLRDDNTGAFTVRVAVRVTPA